MKINKKGISVLLASMLICGSMITPSFATDLEDFEEQEAIHKKIDGEYKIGDTLSFKGKGLHKYTFKVDKTTKLNVDMTFDCNTETKSDFKESEEPDFNVYNSKGECMTNCGRCITLDKSRNVYVYDTIQLTLPADTYTIYYYSHYSKLTINYVKTKLIVNDVYAGSKWINGKTEPNATVKIYINGKKIKSDTALDNGEFSINKGVNNVGEKIKIVATKSGYKEISITKTMKASKFYSDSFEFNKVYDTDTKITGKYWHNYDLMPKIEVYKGNKKIGTVKFDGSKWEGFTMSCKIPKQKKGTKLTIKVKGKGYNTLTKNITVRSKYYTCKYGKKHYDTHACGCKYMTSSVRKNLKKYEVYNVKVKDIYGDIGCSGTFVNNTKTRWDYVEIMVKFYDKNGHVLCTNFTNTLDVAPNEKWNWKVLGYDTSKTSYVRITKITTSKY